MARDEQHGNPDRSPVDFKDGVGLAWGSRTFDDPAAVERALENASKRLHEIQERKTGGAMPPGDPDRER